MTSKLITLSLTLPLILIGAAGCASTEVTSNKSQTFNDPVDGVVVVTQFGTSMDKFEKTFGSEIIRLLGDRGVTAEVIRVGGLELDPPDPVERAQAIGASVILAIGQTEGRTMSDGSLMNIRDYIFDASIIDMASRERVWRAQIHSKLDSYSGEVTGAKIMAQRTFEKMEEDGIISKNVNGSAQSNTNIGQ